MAFFKITFLILLLLLITFSIVVYASNKKTERQKFQVVKSFDGFEIRFYPKAIMATVKSADNSYMGNSNTNFRRLAGYIFGGNETSNKISMTAPVYMKKDNGSNKMSFVMPSNYQMNQLPAPQDSSVQLHYSDEGYYAAIKFGGYAKENMILRKEDELKSKLSEAGYEIIGSCSYLSYNAPWDFINRENNVIVKIKYK
jgi:hypothetical protein